MSAPAALAAETVPSREQSSTTRMGTAGIVARTDSITLPTAAASLKAGIRIRSRRSVRAGGLRFCVCGRAQEAGQGADCGPGGPPHQAVRAIYEQASR